MKKSPNEAYLICVGTNNYIVDFWFNLRPLGFSHRFLDAFVDDIQEMRSKGLSKAEISKQLKCDWTTLHRFMKEKGIK